MRVLLFGVLRDVAGWREKVFEAVPSSLQHLRMALAAENPRLGAALAGPAVLAAVDRKLVRGDAPLRPGCEVAFMPPMSGG